MSKKIPKKSHKKVSKKTKQTFGFISRLRLIATSATLILIGGGASVYAYSTYHASLTAKPDTVVVQPTAIDKAAATTSTTKPASSTTPGTTTTTSDPAPAVTPTPSSDVPSLTPTNVGHSSTVTTYQSNNWAGYLSTGGNFTSVAGSWTTPNPTGTSSSVESGDGTWIGIGGVTTTDLIQIGTEDTISPSGVLSTEGFYELLPAGAHSIVTVPIQPGDVISASITQTLTNIWTISLTDVTSGQTFSTTVSYTSSLSTAEWIQEDPSYPDGSLVLLDSFGSVPFTNAVTTMGGTTYSAAASNASAITMIQGGVQVASPSPINGSSFTVQRH